MTVTTEGGHVTVSTCENVSHVPCDFYGTCLSRSGKSVDD